MARKAATCFQTVDNHADETVRPSGFQKANARVDTQIINIKLNGTNNFTFPDAESKHLNY